MNAHTVRREKTEEDPRALRDVLGEFATGVTIVTCIGDDGAPVGLAANSFASVSLDPPLVVWSLDLRSPSLGAFRRYPAFAINILCEDSRDMALTFARPSENKFADVDWHPGLEGVPVLDGASAVLQCRTEARLPGGDHEMYLGRVVTFRGSRKPPLLFHGGRFARLGDSL